MTWLCLAWLLLPGCWNPKPEERPADWWKAESGWCGDELGAEHLDAAVDLGRSYLLASQQPDGRFLYEYDWKTQQISKDDNQVRQAGATWGLALVHRAAPTLETRAALVKSLAFWRGHEVQGTDGRRWVTYPGDPKPKTGTLALVALSIIELLASDGATPQPDSVQREDAELRAALDGYLAQLATLRRPDGLFFDGYAPADGKGVGAASPYCDGEALLALVKAARELGRDDLWPIVEAAAQAGYDLNVTRALGQDPDSDTTKGYYQWGSMSWYELHQSGRPGTEIWGDRLMDTAVWMIDTHKTLQRTKNTAYAYEGLVPAYAVAVKRGDPRASKFSCTIQAGLGKLVTWQVGHPRAIPALAAADGDAVARGGIQNHAQQPALRIDVVQHQTHAIQLARELWLPARR